MLNKHKTGHIVRVILLNMLFIVLCFIKLLPILYAVSVSFNAQNSLVDASFSFIPTEFTLDNYLYLFANEPIGLWAGNTAIIAVATIFISLAVGVPAAYVFSRFTFKGRKTILTILILLNAFPALLSMFALFKLFTPVGLVNSRIGLIAIYAGTMSIFSLWNMKGYFDSIPQDIEDAARIDGANEFQVITKIVMPLAAPAIIVTVVMIMIFVWNEYLFATQFMTGENNYTLAAGLYSLQAGEMSGSWPIFAAASIAVSLPILIIFLLVQRYMVSGLSAGGVKG